MKVLLLNPAIQTNLTPRPVPLKSLVYHLPGYRRVSSSSSCRLPKPFPGFLLPPFTCKSISPHPANLFYLGFRPDGVVTVEFYDKNKQKLNFPTTIGQRQPNGDVLVTYTPTCAGETNMVVKIDGKEISQGFKLSVIQPKGTYPPIIRHSSLMLPGRVPPSTDRQKNHVYPRSLL